MSTTAQLGRLQLGRGQLGAAGAALSSLTLSGPSSGVVNVLSAPFTVTYNNPTISVLFTPTDSSGNGSFNVVQLGLSAANPVATFYYTPTTLGVRDIGGTNSGGLADPSAVSYNAVPSLSYIAQLGRGVLGRMVLGAFTSLPVGVARVYISGPSSVATGKASTNFTFSILNPASGNTTVTPTSSLAGTWTPSTLTLNNATRSGTATFTPSAIGSGTVSATANNGASVGDILTFTASDLTYYISAAGNDSNDGHSTGAAWLTPGKIVSVGIQRGATYNFRGGDTFTAVSFPINDGNTGANLADLITFQSYGTGRATLKNTNGTTSPFHLTNCGGLDVFNLKVEGKGPLESDGSQSCVTCDGSTAQTLRNIKVRNCELKNVAAGVTFYNDAVQTVQSPEITGNEMHAMWLAGFVFYSAQIMGTYQFKTPLITGNNIHHIDGNLTGTSNQQSHGFVLANTTGALIQGNLIHDIALTSTNGGTGMVGVHNELTLVRGNEVYNIFGTGASDADGIDIDWSSRFCVVEFNYVHNCDASGLSAFEYSVGAHPPGAPQWTDNHYRYNIVQNCGVKNFGAFGVFGDGMQNCFVYNNAFLFTAGGANQQVHYNAGIAPATGCVGFWFLNNIFLGSTSAVKVVSFPAAAGSNADQHWKGNLYYSVGAGNVVFDWRGTTYNNVAAWQAGTSQDSVAISADPTLTDAFTSVIFDDPTLLSTLTKASPLGGSPVINAGLDLTASPYSYTGITRDFRGTTVPIGAFDIGAVEYQGSPSFISAYAISANQ